MSFYEWVSYLCECSMVWEIVAVSAYQIAKPTPLCTKNTFLFDHRSSVSSYELEVTCSSTKLFDDCVSYFGQTIIFIHSGTILMIHLRLWRRRKICDADGGDCLIELSDVILIMYTKFNIIK